jgi:sugar lactone lactonase YvrE
MLACACVLANAQNIFSVAGLGYSHRDSVDGKPALDAPLGWVYGLLFDKTTGRLLFHDSVLVMRLEPDGSLLTLAGLGRFLDGDTADGTPASFLQTSVLRGMAQDSTGALYVSDAEAGRVYRIALDGTVSTFAGGGTQPPGPQSYGGPATAAALRSPRGLVFDSKGNLNIAEVYCNCIRRVSPDGTISTVATLDEFLANVEGLTIDRLDNLYVTEWLGNQVLKVTPDGTATIIGGPDAFREPSGTALDIYGNLYIADTDNHRIRKIAADGTITTIAGAGSCGFSGDGGPALAAQLCLPAEVAFDSSGNLYVADYGNHRVRRIGCVVGVFSCAVPSGTITTVAGNGQDDPALSAPTSSGDGGPAIHATFHYLGGIAYDGAGNLYAADRIANRVRRIAPNGMITTIAGTGQRGYSGDGGPATQALLFGPDSVWVGPGQSEYVISDDSRIRKITPDGIISLVAGDGNNNGPIRSQGDGGLAVNAAINEPGGIAFDAQGNVYIADTSNARVRKVDTNGIITTVAGPGQLGVDYYNAVAVDPQGNLYVVWTHAPPGSVSSTVNRVNPDGSLTPVVGNGQPCVSGPGAPFAYDGAPALQAQLCAIVGMVIDQKGVMYLSEGAYQLVLEIGSDGTLRRVVGDPQATKQGDGGLALRASLNGGYGWSPSTVTFDPAGNLYFAESGLNRIREVTSTALTLKVSVDHIDLSGSGSVSSPAISVSTNFAEPFPYQVRVSTTDGNSWLTTNRVTGLTGEPFTVITAPSNIPNGVYHGTVSVILPGVEGASNPLQVDVPVTFNLTIPPGL